MHTKKWKCNQCYSYLIILMLIIGLDLICVSCASPKLEQTEIKASLEDVFDIEETIYLQGSEETPIFSSYNLFVMNGKVYIPDYIGNSVNIYKNNGELIKKIGGKKGQKKGDLSMPYGVVVDSNGFIYVNDRGNKRIQVFYPSFEFFREYKIDRQIETILLSYNASFFAVAVAPTFSCDKRFPCLILELNLLEDKKSSFGIFKKEYLKYTWAACTDNNNIFYICNKYENEIHIFDSDRKLKKKIYIQSPTMKSTDIKGIENPREFSDIIKNRRTLNQREHTSIGRIYVKDKLLFILFRVRGGQIKSTKFILDILDQNRNILFYNIEVPGELFCVTDKFYFAKQNEETEFGSVKISGLKLLKEKIEAIN